jgi:hypothetical protein
MNDFVIKSIEEFESYFYRRIRGLDTNKDNIKKRIQKFYELVVLKENASPLGFQQKEIIVRRIKIGSFSHLKIQKSYLFCDIFL